MSMHLELSAARTFLLGRSLLLPLRYSRLTFGGARMAGIPANLMERPH